MDASESWCSRCGALQVSNRAVPETFDTSFGSGTRYHALLNSNEPPKDSEDAFIRSVVLDAEASLADLDAEISKIEGRWKQLEEERASLSNYIARHKAILSPIRHIPPELLGQIFSLTLPSIAEGWDREYMADSPWVLSHTCSWWRAISLSLPQLWSRVVVDYDKTAYPTASVIKAQIQRAQKLRIYFHGSQTIDALPQIHMFKLLSQHSAQWEDLSLGLTPQILPHLAPLHDRLPSLERLWIKWDALEAETPVESLSCFQSAPSLVDFGVYNENAVLPITFPAHNLTRLQLDGPWERQMLTLGLGHNLVEAHIAIEFDNRPWPQIGEPIALLHLRRLYISHWEALDYLWAPALEELGLLTNHEDRVADILRPLESFHTRSACPLRRLHFRGLPDIHQNLRILGKFACITELALTIEATDVQETDLLMAALTVSQDNTVVAPQLRALFVGCSNDTYGRIDSKLYLELLRFRWGTEGCALKGAALLIECHGPDATTLQDLGALRQEGLDLLVLEGEAATMEMDAWLYIPTWFH